MSRDSPALAEADRCLSYDEFSAGVALVATNLAAAGVSTGDRVAVMLPILHVGGLLVILRDFQRRAFLELAENDEGYEVAAGQEGELWIAGPMIVPGYWNNPAADAAAFVGGYWKSGDIGAVDAQGFVRIAVATQREEDFQRALEPMDLMLQAVKVAGYDSRASSPAESLRHCIAVASSRRHSQARARLLRNVVRYVG